MGLGYFKNVQIEKQYDAKLGTTPLSGELYQTFLNLLPDGVAILSDDHQLKYVNSSMSRVLGCSEENTLASLLGLNNEDAEEEDNVAKRTDFQKKITKKKAEQARTFATNARTINLKNAMQVDDINFSVINVSQEKHTTEKSRAPSSSNQHAARHPRAVPFFSKIQFGRAQTYSTPNQESVISHLTKELKASNTIKIDEKNGIEDLNFEKDRSEDNVSILRSQPQASQIQGEQQNLAVPDLFGEDGTERQSEEIKNTGNAYSYISGVEQKSFTKKKTFQLEKKHTPEISFVGQLRGTQIERASLPYGGFGISQSMIPSQGSNFFKIIPSQIFSPNNHSNDLTPKNSGNKGSIDNVIAQKSIQPSQAPSPQHRRSLQIKTITPIEPTASIKQNSNSSPKSPLKAAKTTPLFAIGRNATTIGPGTASEENSPLRPSKKLTSYETKLRNVKAVYQSIMRKLKKVEGPETEAKAEKGKISIMASIIRFLRNTMRFRKQTGKLSSDLERSKKEYEEVKFNLKEENCCVIVNSKLKVGAVERSLEVNLTPTVMDNTPYLLVLVKGQNRKRYDPSPQNYGQL